MDIYDKLIELRITLSTYCDGFNVKNFSKNTSLSARTKILHLLSTRDLSPNEIIAELAIAKSNVAIITKSMIDDGVIISYKKIDNTRNIYYSITENGIQELQNYKETFRKILDVKSEDIEDLDKSINKILNVIRK